MPGNIQNIHTSHFLITWIVFLSIKCTKSQTQAGDSCDLVNFVFCLALPGFPQVNTSGRETICSDGDGVGEKGVCVCFGCTQQEDGVRELLWGVGHWGMNPAEWGHNTYTHSAESAEPGCMPGTLWRHAPTGFHTSTHTYCSISQT